MKTRRTVLGLMALGAAVVLGGCGSRRTLRYKMTVEVETPQGVKTGFAVREIVIRRPPAVPMLGEDRGSISVRGEAVAVALPDGQTLFALLTSGDHVVDYAGRDVFFLFRELEGPHIQLWPDPPSTSRPQITNPLPLLVRFRDISDPTSVERVEPTALDAAFGPGVTLKRITIEKTREDVTVGIEKRLGWLGNHNDSLIPASLESSDEIKKLSPITEMSFSQGRAR